MGQRTSNGPGRTGDDTRIPHDAFVAALAQSLRSAQVNSATAAYRNRFCAYIFSDLLFLCTDDSEMESQLNGIIAGLSVDL